MITKKHIVSVTNGLIQFDPLDQTGWELLIEEIRAIIEYTTEEGPFGSDHFLVFIDSSATEFHLPLDSEGCLDAIKQIGKVLRTDVNLKLSSSTYFVSRVVFPSSIAESKGYVLEKTPRSLTQKFFSLGQEVSMVLSDEVRRSL